MISLVAAQGDTFELFEFAKGILDQMPPLVNLGSNLARTGASGMLGNHDLGAAFVEVSDHGIREGGVGDQTAEGDIVDQRRNADGLEAMARQQDKADQIAERIGERQDLCRPAALRLADGLALRPPLAPCPWRWTLTMVASTMAYSMSGSSATASKIRWKTPAFTQ